MLHPLDNHCRFEHLTSWVAHLQNLKRCGKNLQLSTEHPSVVDAYLRNNPVQTVSPAFRTHPPYSGSNQMRLVLSPKVTTREMAVNCWPFCPWRIQHKWLHWEGPPLCLRSVPIIFIRILGIEVDTVQLQLRLPPEKFHCLNKSIREWRGKSCRKRELLSLLGSLQHAVKVVKPSQAFVHRMIELSTVHKHMDACSRINQQFWGDLEWWYQMVSTWNASKYSPRHRKTLHLGQ